MRLGGFVKYESYQLYEHSCMPYFFVSETVNFAVYIVVIGFAERKKIKLFNLVNWRSHIPLESDSLTLDV